MTTLIKCSSHSLMMTGGGRRRKKGRTVRACAYVLHCNARMKRPRNTPIVPVCPCFFLFLFFCYVRWKYSAVEFETCRRYQVDWLDLTRSRSSRRSSRSSNRSRLSKNWYSSRRVFGPTTTTTSASSAQIDKNHSFIHCPISSADRQVRNDATEKLTLRIARLQICHARFRHQGFPHAHNIPIRGIIHRVPNQPN